MITTTSNSIGSRRRSGEYSSPVLVTRMRVNLRPHFGQSGRESNVAPNLGNLTLELSRWPRILWPVGWSDWLGICKPNANAREPNVHLT